MLEIDCTLSQSKYAHSVLSLSSGGMKDQITQTNELENKGIETEKM